MSELKLLKCPFCGGEAYTDKIGKPLFTIRCTNINCYCEISKNSLEDAINAWNTRTPMANIVEKLEVLKNGASGCNGVMCENCEYNDICFEGEQSFRVALDKAINIVKQEMGVIENEPTNN